MPQPRAYKTMTAEKKLQAIKDAKIQGVKPAARMWNTSPATIRYWRKQEEELSRLVGDIREATSTMDKLGEN